MESKIFWAKEKEEKEEKASNVLGYIFLIMLILPIAAMDLALSLRIFLYFLGR